MFLRLLDISPVHCKCMNVFSVKFRYYIIYALINCRYNNTEPLYTIVNYYIIINANVVNSPILIFMIKHQDRSNHNIMNIN